MGEIPPVVVRAARVAGGFVVRGAREVRAARVAGCFVVRGAREFRAARVAGCFVIRGDRVVVRAGFTVPRSIRTTISAPRRPTCTRTARRAIASSSAGRMPSLAGSSIDVPSSSEPSCSRVTGFAVSVTYAPPCLTAIGRPVAITISATSSRSKYASN